MKVLSDPVARLLSLLPRGTEAGAKPKRTIVGLTGLPGSGKSTLATRLAQSVNQKLGSNVMVALGMDGFHLYRAQLAAVPDPAAAFKRRGAPWTFDPTAMAEHLKALRKTDAQRTVMWPGFEHGVGDPVPDAIAIEPSVQLVLVEGLYLLHRADGWQALDGLLDECWYLDVPMDTALERLKARHMAAWGWTAAQALERIAENDGANAQTVLASRSRADFLVA